ncbi:MAG: hypothetical protein FWD28_03870 [Treponema sp.]|nr:hypothetical protein [Treponema sp.]
MKKFLITLIILIILASAGFLFGWVQFSVPPGKYGVIHSKTHGTDSAIVKSGEFRWVWYKLIPTNVNISIFSIDHFRFPLVYSGSLPSANTYASFAGIPSADFSWDINGEISFRANPDMLIKTAEKYNLSNQEELNAHLQKIGQEIETLVLRLLSSAVTDNERLEQIMLGHSDSEIESEISVKFPEIHNFSMTINTAKYPNFVLYRQLRLLYDEFLTRQREYISNSFARRAESNVIAQLRFEELERYGDLLTRFPILLEYLAIER